MRWIFRLQQHLALTQSEARVLLVLALLFGLGLGAQQWQAHPRPLPPAAYADATQHFQQASSENIAPTAAPTAVEAEEPTSKPRKTYRKKALPPAPIDLNTATAGDLQRLPRIGPKLAARILAYREAHGSFRRVQDLTRVRGIGQKTLTKLAPYLVVQTP